MVIELLKITCPADRREAFVELDAKVWTPALAQQPGFMGKEVWTSLDDPCQVALVIRWESMSHWKSFPAQMSRELETQMDGVQLNLLCESYEVAV